MMKNKYFTFLYMPEEGGGLKTVRVRRWLAFAVIGVVVAVVAVNASVWLVGPRGRSESPRVTAVVQENAVLRAQIGEYARQVESLERHVQQNFDFQRKARLLANLEDLDEDVTQVGIGGPEFGPIESMSVLDEGARARLSTLGADIDKLTRQARLQRESYEEIIERLDANQRLLAATPSVRPVAAGYVSSRFGRRMDPFTGRTSWHYGVDYSARLGTPIITTADGVVTFCGKWYEFGWTVEVSHGHGFVTRYAHCSKLLVPRGQRVKRGETIARVGSSGRSTATHLHYEVILNGSKKNPLAYVLSGREVVD